MTHPRNICCGGKEDSMMTCASVSKEKLCVTRCFYVSVSEVDKINVVGAVNNSILASFFLLDIYPLGFVKTKKYQNERTSTTITLSSRFIRS